MTRSEKFDAKRFCRDFRIPIAPPSSKHYRAGWLNLHCPFCRSGAEQYHLGWSSSTGAWNCYRCGAHGTTDVVRRLTGLDGVELRETLARYRGRGLLAPPTRIAPNTVLSATRLPPGSGPLDQRGRDYLAKRGFDPEELIRLWGLVQTGPVGPYKYRIVAPITLDGRIVSFQGRDLTGKSELRYKACSIENEAVHHKHFLYGYDYAKENRTVVIVEGITGVWRLGPGAVATFGAKYTEEQVNLLRKWPERIVMFDADEAGVTNGRKLADTLSAFSGTTILVTLENGDPGDMPDFRAKRFMTEWGLTPKPTSTV